MRDSGSMRVREIGNSSGGRETARKADQRDQREADQGSACKADQSQRPARTAEQHVRLTREVARKADQRDST